jgi:hypothetical protein
MMRGQATSTQHRLSEIFSLACRAGSYDPSLRGGAKRLATGLSPTNQWSTTTMPQGKLPSYLQSLHHIRPARPSMGSSGLGLDVPSNLSVKQNTWKLPDISSLHNVCRTRISQSQCKTFISSEDIVIPQFNTKRIGGAERDRTADPLLAKQVLSQLSYSPNHRNT